MAWSEITILKRIQETIQVQAQELRRARNQLEQRVRERTGELNRANRELKESEQRLRHLSSEQLRAQENERRVIALDLHDSLGSQLAAVKYALESALGAIRAGDPLAETALEKAIATAQSAIDESRRIMTHLRPSILDDLGIIATINWYVREFQGAYARFHLKTRITVKEEDIPELLKTVIFRVMQEALNNAARHSGGDQVVLELTRERSKLVLQVNDNGAGFNVEKMARQHGSLGLSSMRERVEISGGRFTIQSAPGKGTVIRAEWSI